ncbi:hypothetical protein HPB50_028747 [Hyalomma asiaticum]|nr:hypothetical protein HPB50_028747 [Hyalomma asiaticum]
MSSDFETFFSASSKRLWSLARGRIVPMTVARLTLKKKHLVARAAEARFVGILWANADGSGPEMMVPENGALEEREYDGAAPSTSQARASPRATPSTSPGSLTHTSPMPMALLSRADQEVEQRDSAVSLETWEPDPSRNSQQAVVPAGSTTPGAGNPSSENYTSNPIALVKEDPGDMSSLIGNGAFQFIILLFAQVASALLTIHHLSMRLFLAPVDHWCRPPLEYSLSPEIWKNTSIPLTPDGTYSKCYMYHPTAHTANGSRVEVPCNEWQYDLSTGSKSVVSEWNLVCDREWYICIAFLYNRLGAILVVPFSGQISDRIGRQPVICTCIVVAVASAVMSIVSKSFLAFVVSCMLLAASLGIIKLLIVILLFENSGEGYRDFYVCLAKFGATYGTVLVAMMDYYAKQRIVLNLTVFVIAVLLTSAYCFVDESVSWLLAYRDYDRAEHVIQRASSRNRQPYAGHYIFSSNSSAYRPTSQLDINFVTFVATHELRCRTAILSWILLCLFLVQYGMMATCENVDTLGGKALLVLVRSCSYPLAWKLLRDFPRKSALSMALPLTCCLLCLMSVTKGLEAASVTWILEEVVTATIVAEAIVVYVFALELFPTVIRGMGTSIVYFFGQLAVMLAPYVIMLASHVHPNMASVIFTALILSALGILRFLPETKERKLPRTMDDLLP